jgi:hypothetical protein
MVRNLFGDSFGGFGSKRKFLLLLHVPSGLYGGFVDSVIISIRGTVIRLQNDKVIQTAHGAIRDNNKKDFHSGIEHCVLPPRNQRGPIVINFVSVYRDILRVFRQHNKNRQTGGENSVEH